MKIKDFFVANNKMLKYSLPCLIKEYNDNRNIITAYLQGENIESFNNDPTPTPPKVSGMVIGVFVTALIISLILWIWGLVVLILHWPVLQDWAKYIGIIGIVIGFPLITVIAGYTGRKS